MLTTSAPTMKTLVLTWANAITFARLVLILPYLIFLQEEPTATPPLILAIMIILGDKLDGFLARRLKQGTIVGAAFDWLTDVLFVISSFIILFPSAGWSVAQLLVILLPRIIVFLLNGYYLIFHRTIFMPTKTLLNHAYAIGLYLLTLALLIDMPQRELLFALITIIGIAFSGSLFVHKRLMAFRTVWGR